jgi:hypothetical protein
MPYLICDNCEIYYEIEENFNLNSFDTCENCDNNLKLYNNLDDYYKDNIEPQRENIIVLKLMLKRKISKYTTIITMGEIFGLIGLIGFIITPLSIIILVISAGLIFYGYNKSKSWNKGIKGEYIVAEYLNQLPNDYYIFNDVKFPGSFENIEYVVIGPNGIFVIENKNYNGYYIIDSNNWFYKSGRNVNKTYSNPGKQVMANTMSLRTFLIDNGINMDGVWIHSIVTLLNNNFEFQKLPEYYKVLDPSQLPFFILSVQKSIDQDIWKNAALLIEPYCIERLY